MTLQKPAITTLNEQASTPGDATWELRLYIAGQTVRSLRAIHNLQRICEQQLAGQYRIEIVDLSEHPGLARTDDIVALPTLVRQLPLPARRIIGDLSETDQVLAGLDVVPATAA